MYRALKRTIVRDRAGLKVRSEERVGDVWWGDARGR